MSGTTPHEHWIKSLQLAIVNLNQAAVKLQEIGEEKPGGIRQLLHSSIIGLEAAILRIKRLEEEI